MGYMNVEISGRNEWHLDIHGNENGIACSKKKFTERDKFRILRGAADAWMRNMFLRWNGDKLEIDTARL